MRLIYNIHQEEVSLRLWSWQEWARCCQTASIYFLTILTFRGKILSHPNSSVSALDFSPLHFSKIHPLGGKNWESHFSLHLPILEIKRRSSKKYVDLDWHFALFLAIGRGGTRLPFSHLVFLHLQVPQSDPPSLTPRGCSSNSCFEVL